jgi:hypothetical protein
MIFGKQFLDFFENKNIGKWIYDDNSRKESYTFSFDEFKEIQKLDIVFNGLKGGLILGNLHYQGGIHLIIPNLENRSVIYAGEMEGWEYLSSPIIYEEIGKEFEKINLLEKNRPEFELTEFNIPLSCKVVDTLNKRPLALLVISGYKQYIVNRFATRKYIDQLIQLDLKNENTNI